MRVLARLFFFLAMLGIPAPQATNAAQASSSPKSWWLLLADRIPVYGHRNWIVIADSAYPAQSKEGVETVLSNADQLEVLRDAMAQLADAKHVTPIIYTDQELNFLDEQDVKGVTEYRRRLEIAFKGRTVHSLPHEQLIDKLDDVSKTFRVLIIKTNMTIPYSTIFLQLDCAYWSPEAEKRLRAKMSQGQR